MTATPERVPVHRRLFTELYIRYALLGHRASRPTEPSDHLPKLAADLLQVAFCRLVEDPDGVARALEGLGEHVSEMAAQPAHERPRPAPTSARPSRSKKPR